MQLADYQSGRQDAPFTGRTLYFNILFSPENLNSPNHSLAPIDLKELYKRITTCIVLLFVTKITKLLNAGKKG